MTIGPGPSLPRPVTGQNAIGRFRVGLDQIGDIPLFDYWTTVISQYANSKILIQLISNFNQCVDQTKNLSDFFDLVWNVDTAQGYGLDVWGRIVGVQRVLQVAVGVNFGFSGPGGASGDSFNTQAFNAGASLTSNFALPDLQFRTLIFAKALADISDGSIKSINQILLNLFPKRGNCFATDGLNMTMTYTFSFALSAVELAIISQSGALPKPTGVIATVIHP